ncbi:MAG TPA: helical backbone metal receptor [Marinobacter sp.]|nr:helical backbone metal receptor [Marinobacter sp.]
MRLSLTAAALALTFMVGAGVAFVALADEHSPRIVSADGSVTETIYALAAEDLLVGVDTTSNYPPAVKSLPRVGYLRALPFEGVLALRPDMLLTTVEAAPDKTLERLEQAGIEVIRLPVAYTPEDTLERIRRIGEVVGKQANAKAMMEDIQARIQHLEKTVNGADQRVLFLMVAGGHGVTIAGADTTANALLETLGATNAMASVDGYKPAGREALLASRPDAIVIAETRPGEFKIADWPQLAALDAWKQGRYYVGDAMLLLGFGPRLAQALEAVASVLKPVERVAGNDT